ncbi:hypothetical protein GOB93_11260 [Acetobacter musti]|uniref:Uncharacterized protein n=1 Tax=Acetobacter musti TaxID=864732 RepID=A0ABX0JP36_9PROT|nr:hypothetical protein [Acetobacter musti]NHN85216.1 hypothetical protein [Acetobacter musti]
MSGRIVGGPVGAGRGVIGRIMSVRVVAGRNMAARMMAGARPGVVASGWRDRPRAGMRG